MWSNNTCYYDIKLISIIDLFWLTKKKNPLVLLFSLQGTQ
jgi:hypothetical protein